MHLGSSIRENEWFTCNAYNLIVRRHCLTLLDILFSVKMLHTCKKRGNYISKKKRRLCSPLDFPKSRSVM